MAERAHTGTRVISIGGGKGGVGKSIVSMNLAATFAGRGLRVVLVDLDLGAANLHLLLGLSNPKPGVATLLRADSYDLREALTPTNVPNLQLLAGTGAVLGAADISVVEKARILRKLKSLEADLVVVDVGAGVGYNALDFFELGAQRLVVATPQVTSIHDSYSFLKGAVLRILQRQATKAGEAALLKPAEASGETEKVAFLLARIREQNPEFAAKVEHTLKTFGAYMIGNQVTDPAQGSVFHSVSKLMMEYLGISVPILGWLRANPKIHESVNKRSPFVLGTTSGEDGRAFRAIADTLLVEEVKDDDLLLEEDPGPFTAPAPRPAQAQTQVAAAPQVSARATAPQEPRPPSGTTGLEPPSPKVLSRPYVPPTRKKEEKKARKRAPEETPRVRKWVALPGMTPRPRG